MNQAKLPNLDHFLYHDYEKFYEPSDDTFLLCDALLNDISYIIQSKPTVCLEIGSGSGCVITYLSQLLASYSLYSVYIAIDINQEACAATQRTAAANNQVVDVICTNFLSLSFSLSLSLSHFIV
mmetsp:Transcript_7435/g.7657  ORF Transcript_7435/g.7657 Transcript_7435/m.7657 type:complete len:124 (+) Transcript_7435:111-482(+)